MTKIKPDLLIFDFDGTIVDSKHLYYGSMHKYLKKHGIKENKIDKVIDMGSKLDGILEELGFSWISKWWLRRKIMNDVLDNLDRVSKCRDVSVLKKISKKKLLVTNSSSNFVYPLVNHFNLKNSFSGIYTADDFKNKADFIKKYLDKEGIKNEKCLYIGDRVADIKLAKDVGCLSVAVIGKCAWDSSDDLIEEGPDFVINDLKELQELLD